MTHFIKRLLPFFFVWGLILMIFWLLPSKAVHADGPIRDSKPVEPPVEQVMRPRAQGPEIVGGEEAEPGAWPWQVALVNSSTSNLFDGQFCGGSLIDDEWVVTAAHCAFGDHPSDIDVVAGVHDLNNSDLEISGQRVAVAEIILHEAYDPFDPDHDIALLRLSKPLILGASSGITVGLLSLVEPNVGTLEGITSTVTGWGVTSEGGMGSGTVQQVELPIISNEVCENSYDSEVSEEDWISENMLCAAFIEEGGRDACQGDSGGPMVIYDEASQEWQLAGIVSWGIGCARPTIPGVYTRVSRYTDWIVENTTPGFTVEATPAEVSLCIADANPNPNPNQATFNVSVAQRAGFTNPVQLTVNGHPTDSTTSFSVNPVMPLSSTILTISNSESPQAGRYDIQLVGTALTTVHTTSLRLNLFNSLPANAALLTPDNGANEQPVTPIFTWNAGSQALSHTIQIATDANFSDIVLSDTTQSTTYTSTMLLQPNSAYYWRIIAHNSCGSGSPSPAFRFTTETPLLLEDFSTAAGSTPPTGWTNHVIAGQAEVDIWRFDNPKDRLINTPISDPAAIFDSDAVSNNNMAESVALESPAFDASAGSDMVLEFDQYFEGEFGGEIFVEIFNGTTWQQVYHTDSSTPAADHQRINITDHIGRARNAQVRFRWEGDWSWYWIVDNVLVTTLPETTNISLAEFSAQAASNGQELGIWGNREGLLGERASRSSVRTASPLLIWLSLLMLTVGCLRYLRRTTI